MACGLEILDYFIRLVAAVVLIVILLKLAFALERWEKR